MDSVTVGMTVRSLDDQTLGTVIAVHSCCLRFALKDDNTSKVSATWAGVFNSHAGVVSLIYVARETHRYACLVHPSVVIAATFALKTGWLVGAGPRSTRAPAWSNRPDAPRARFAAPIRLPVLAARPLTTSAR